MNFFITKLNFHHRHISLICWCDTQVIWRSRNTILPYHYAFLLLCLAVSIQSFGYLSAHHFIFQNGSIPVKLASEFLFIMDRPGRLTSFASIQLFSADLVSFLLWLHFVFWKSVKKNVSFPTFSVEYTYTSTVKDYTWYVCSDHAQFNSGFSGEKWMI